MAAVTGYLINASRLANDVHPRRHSLGPLGSRLDGCGARPSPTGSLAEQRKQQQRTHRHACFASRRTCRELKNLGAALRVPGVIVLLCFQYFFWSFGVYGLVLWIPEMIRSGSSRGIEQVGMLSAAPFLLGVILMLRSRISPIARSSASRSYGRSSCSRASACSSRSQLRAATSGSAYAALIVAGGAMYAPYGPFFAIVPEMLPSNVAGEVIALVNSFGALGGFAGTWLVGWLQALTGTRAPAFSHVDGADCCRS
jgi:hypothetical protein